jgi:hypothetical protein
MILLVTPSERASECGAAINAATGEQVAIAQSLAGATTLLRIESYRVVVLDQYLLEAEPNDARTAIEHLDTAIPLQVNLAIVGMERLVREVRMAMQRRQREEIQARNSAVVKLHSELNGTITALLLSIQLARETPDLPASAAVRLQWVHELVNGLWKQLEGTATAM